MQVPIDDLIQDDLVQHWQPQPGWHCPVLVTSSRMASSSIGNPNPGWLRSALVTSSRVAAFSVCGLILDGLVQHWGPIPGWPRLLLSASSRRPCPVLVYSMAKNLSIFKLLFSISSYSASPAEASSPSFAFGGEPTDTLVDSILLQPQHRLIFRAYIGFQSTSSTIFGSKTTHQHQQVDWDIKFINFPKSQPS